MQLQQLSRPAGIAKPLARRAVVAVRAVARPTAAAAPAPAAAAAAASSPLSAALPLALLAAAGPLLLDAPDALATGGAFGLLEGRTAALVHPAVMIVLFGLTSYAGFLGWQWRRTRTIGDEIKALKAQLPKPAADGAAAPPSPLDGQIAALEKVRRLWWWCVLCCAVQSRGQQCFSSHFACLIKPTSTQHPTNTTTKPNQQERKDLVAGGFRDKHSAAGAVLLAFGVGIAVEGCLNTWMRTGKLFPGPHLFAGAGIVVLWALAAALVPSMQKGNETARSAHIALNALNLALFAWQVPTGFDIVNKVFQFTSWP